MAKAIEGGRGPNPWRVAGWSIAALLLLLPLGAMQFTREVNWTPFDFAFATVMIGSVGIAFELTVRATRNNAYRGAVAIALAAAFLLVWINGAAGIIGDEDNPLNLLYVGIIAIAFGAAAWARFRARGASRAMVFAAIANIAVGVVAVIAGRDDPPGVVGLIVLNGFFVALFLGSAWLFGVAAQGQDRIVPHAVRDAKRTAQSPPIWPLSCYANCKFGIACPQFAGGFMGAIGLIALLGALAAPCRLHPNARWRRWPTFR